MNTSNPKGVLIPIGGNEDKGTKNPEEVYALDFVEEGILSHIVNLAGGTDSSIVVVPTASSIPVEVSENYRSAFEQLGCTNIHIMDIRKKTDSERSDFIELTQKADCIMFSGGNQSKISSKIGGSTIHKIIAERYENEEGFVIAGTSAGAMAMSKYMIAGGSSPDSLFKGNVIMKNGLGLLPSAIIDTHFVQRGRFGRITEAIAKHPECLGIGLAEDTGLIIKNGHDCTVIGSGMVILFDGSQFQHNNCKILEEGTPMSVGNMIVHVLANSDMFDLNTRKMEILNIDAPFI